MNSFPCPTSIHPVGWFASTKVHSHHFLAWCLLGRIFTRSLWYFVSARSGFTTCGEFLALFSGKLVSQSFCRFPLNGVDKLCPEKPCVKYWVSFYCFFPGTLIRFHRRMPKTFPLFRLFLISFLAVLLILMQFEKFIWTTSISPNPLCKQTN